MESERKILSVKDLVLDVDNPRFRHLKELRRQKNLTEEQWELVNLGDKIEEHRRERRQLEARINRSCLFVKAPPGKSFSTRDTEPSLTFRSTRTAGSAGHAAVRSHPWHSDVQEQSAVI